MTNHLSFRLGKQRKCWPICCWCLAF